MSIAYISTGQPRLLFRAIYGFWNKYTSYPFDNTAHLICLPACLLAKLCHENIKFELISLEASTGQTGRGSTVHASIVTLPSLSIPCRQKNTTFVVCIIICLHMTKAQNLISSNILPWNAAYRGKKKFKFMTYAEGAIWAFYNLPSVGIFTSSPCICMYFYNMWYQSFCLFLHL